MSSFVLKLIACVTMFIDHIGYAIFNGSSWFNYIGRLAFPIFAFQISEGYIHTRSIKKYLLRLFLFALVSQIPFMLFHSIISEGFYLNVIFTLLFGLISIVIYDKYNKFTGIMVAISLGIIASFLNCDYGFYGVFITFLFYVLNKNKLLLATGFVLTTLIRYSYYIIDFCLQYGIGYLGTVVNFYLPSMIGTVASILFILLYNKKKGYNTKYLLYLFYPLHMLLIYGISFVI